MTQCVAEAVFVYVMDFVPILDNAHIARRITLALAMRILMTVDWVVISQIELVDILLTMMRRKPSSVKRLVVPVFDRAFHDAFNYRLLFSSCVDRAIGPDVLSGVCEYPSESVGPDECTRWTDMVNPELL